MKNLKGHLLIAIPDLSDPNFFRSVVLMIQHDSEGAMGVILNRPSSITVANVWREVSETPCDCPDFVNVGGPVEGPLIAIHTCPDLAESELIQDVYVSLARENLNALVSQNQHRFRLFSGYSGWGAEQLQNEIQVGGWLIVPANIDHVFAPPNMLWKQVCEAFGSQVLQAQLGQHLPTDPSLN